MYWIVDTKTNYYYYYFYWKLAPCQYKTVVTNNQ